MISPYNLVVFDWEGTIADTLGAVFNTVAIEAGLLGFGAFDLDEARKYVDLGLVRALTKVYPQLSIAEQEQLLQAVQCSIHTHSADVFLVPGVLDFIHQLHDAKINLAIATNKGHQSLLRSLQETGLDKIFKVTRSAGQVEAKPHPQMLEEIIAEFDGTIESTIMIGDSPTDMEMAKNIHVRSIGVDFYHQQGTALKAAGALAVFDDYKLLADFLNLKKAG